MFVEKVIIFQNTQLECDNVTELHNWLIVFLKGECDVHISKKQLNKLRKKIHSLITGERIFRFLKV